MKLQELHEGKESVIDKVTKGLSGIKGVKVVVKTADYDDLDGNPLPETYKVHVTYTPDRGVKPTEAIKFYKTADGDWEYLSDSASNGFTDMAETIAAMRKDIEVAQKFHGKSSKVDEHALNEGYEMKVLKVAEADGVRGCFFKGGKLFCDQGDLARVVKLLKKAEAKGEFDMPEVVAVED